jgi:hypothetical protein
VRSLQFGQINLRMTINNHSSLGIALITFITMNLGIVSENIGDLLSREYEGNWG